MEGVSKEANEIYLEVAPENIVKALKTAQNAKWIKIKLTKKHVPCLTFEVDLVGSFKTIINLHEYCTGTCMYSVIGRYIQNLV